MKLKIAIILMLIKLVYGCSVYEVNVKDNPTIKLIVLNNKFNNPNENIYDVTNIYAMQEIIGYQFQEDCLDGRCLLFFWQNKEDLPVNAKLNNKDIDKLVHVYFNSRYLKSYDYEYPRFLFNCELLTTMAQEEAGLTGCITHKRIFFLLEHFNNLN